MSKKVEEMIKTKREGGRTDYMSACRWFNQAVIEYAPERAELLLFDPTVSYEKVIASDMTRFGAHLYACVAVQKHEEQCPQCQEQKEKEKKEG